MPPPGHRAPPRAAPPAGPPTASSTRSVTSAMRRRERPPRRRTGLEYPRVRPLDVGACGRRAVRSDRAGGAKAARAARDAPASSSSRAGGAQAQLRDLRAAPRRRERGGGDQGAAPARVLAKAQERTRGVVLSRDAGEELEFLTLLPRGPRALSRLTSSCSRRARGRDRSQRERCARAGRRAPGGRLRQPAPRNVLRRIKAAASRAIESTMAPR
jgi:hypothetical protein